MSASPEQLLIYLDNNDNLSEISVDSSRSFVKANDLAQRTDVSVDTVFQMDNCANYKFKLPHKEPPKPERRIFVKQKDHMATLNRPAQRNRIQVAQRQNALAFATVNSANARQKAKLEKYKPLKNGSISLLKRSFSKEHSPAPESKLKNDNGRLFILKNNKLHSIIEPNGLCSGIFRKLPASNIKSQLKPLDNIIYSKVGKTGYVLPIRVVPKKVYKHDLSEIADLDPSPFIIVDESGMCDDDTIILNNLTNHSNISYRICTPEDLNLVKNQEDNVTDVIVDKVICDPLSDNLKSVSIDRKRKTPPTAVLNKCVSTFPISRTRSGRWSRPPKHMRELLMENIALDAGEKCSDIDSVSVSQHANQTMDSIESYPEPEIPAKRMRVIPQNYKCLTCNKIYLGSVKKSCHLKQYPEHKFPPSSTNNGSLLFASLVQKLCTIPAEERAPALLNELSDFVKTIRGISHKLITEKKEYPAQIIDKYVAMLLDIAPGNYCVDIEALQNDEPTQTDMNQLCLDTKEQEMNGHSSNEALKNGLSINSFQFDSFVDANL